MLDAATENERGVMSPLDVLRRDGWCKEHLVDDEGRRCIVGAFEALGGVNDLLDVINEVALEQFPERTDSSRLFFATVDFNNHPDTTFADVEMVLEKAQLRYDEVGPQLVVGDL